MIQKKKKHLLLNGLLLTSSIMVIGLVVLNINNKTSQNSKAAQLINYPYYGKGVIHYTENYITNYSLFGSKYDIPVPDSDVASKTALSDQMISGTECSRYLDLADREINGFKDLGLNFVILGFGPGTWYNLAPTKPIDAKNPLDSNYSFNKLDQWIGKLQKNNIKVVMQLWGTPTWASGKQSPSANGASQMERCKNNPYKDYAPYNAIPSNLNDFADFVEAIAKRYDGKTIENPYLSGSYLKVDDFSFWNEPNLNDFWEGGVGQYETFARMSNLAYQRIKSSAVRPDSTVWGINLSGACCGAYDFIEKMINPSSTAIMFDVYSHHAYPFNFASSPRTKDGMNYHVGRLPELLMKLDSRSEYRDKPIVLSETGYTSNWERQFGIINNGNAIDDRTKAQYVKESLDIINEVSVFNQSTNRISGVANNVYFNPWRWWGTGLVNYYNPDTKKLSFDQKLLAYDVFKNWILYKSVPTDSADAIFPGLLDKQQYVFKNNFYWLRNGIKDNWKMGSLKDLFYTSPNAASINIPTENIDTAYFGFGGFTVVKSDRYWYRSGDTNNWMSNTIAIAYSSSPNSLAIGVPTSNLDVAYFDNRTAPTSGYTVIKGGQYWWRANNTANWITATLQSAYYKPTNSQNLNVPTANIDAAYFGYGGYTIIKGNKYWFVAPSISATSSWYTNTLSQAFSISN
jgi:hypothetical protein